MASVDKQAVAAAFGLAASSYQQHDELQRLSAAQLLSQLPARAFPRVLDAGCGPGSYSLLQHLRREIQCGNVAALLAPVAAVPLVGHFTARRHRLIAHGATPQQACGLQ